MINKELTKKFPEDKVGKKFKKKHIINAKNGEQEKVAGRITKGFAVTEIVTVELSQVK